MSKYDGLAIRPTMADEELVAVLDSDDCLDSVATQKAEDAFSKSVEALRKFEIGAAEMVDPVLQTIAAHCDICGMSANPKHCAEFCAWGKIKPRLEAL